MAPPGLYFGTGSPRSGKLMKDTSHSEQVRQEALKTYKRLK